MKVSPSLVAIILVTPLMLHAKETPAPGKQVEQELTVKVGADDDVREVQIPYLLFLPETYEKQKEPWPLLLFLHGLGESGNGNLDRVKIHGPPKIVDKQPDFPFILISPQCPKPTNHYRDAWQADQLIQLIDATAKTYRVDPHRIYVTGLSMGGFGTWRLAATYPERFAAAVPICGGGKTEFGEALKSLPIWAFHGAKDNVVPHAESQKMVEAVNAAGGAAKLTTYPDAGHNSWTAAYANPDLYKWLLSQKREKP
jgi:predicted peptidase